MFALISRAALLSTTRRTTYIARRAAMAMSSTASPGLPDSPMPILQTLEELRAWRNKAFSEGKSVGFVPTMGALHEGHLGLVQRSLADNDLTVVSIFVNPTQFAPHEDLASYPRTLPQDLIALTNLQSPPPTERTTSAIFLPSVDVMYPPSPSPSTTPSTEVSTFVEVEGLGSTLEGRSRPTFFRGVATVVTKLFNAVQPSHAYFGQKDIQQALLLRRMVGDLLLAHPTPDTLHVVPTARSPVSEDDGLALSSRNAFLNRTERALAPALYRALKKAETVWEEGRSKEAAVRAAVDVFEMEEIVATENGVAMHLDYIEMNDPWTFDAVNEFETKNSGDDDVFILSGAMWVGKTRLIDNIILGDSKKILY